MECQSVKWNGEEARYTQLPFKPTVYYEEYLRQLKRPGGLRYTERPKSVFMNLMKVYGEELLAELKAGSLIWLPAMLGTIELGVFKGYIPIARVKNAEPSFWVHVGWRKRDKVKYAELFKLKTSDRVGKEMKNYYVDNVDEMNKLKQL